MSIPLSLTNNMMMKTTTTSFEVHVSKEDFKFHAAHFVAFVGYREKLHGHNYKVGVRLLGSRQIANDGYVVDFGDIKRVTRTICKQLNEHFLCPMLSDVLEITISEGNDTTSGGDGSSSSSSSSVTIQCQDGSTFVFPKQDCVLLPIMHATAEELAIYLWSKILDGLNATYLRRRGIHTMEVIVAEALGQEAVFRYEVPMNNDDSPGILNVPDFIMKGSISPPKPCPSAPMYDEKSQHITTGCCDTCRQNFSNQLKQLAVAFNENEKMRNGPVTVEDLETILANNVKL